MPRQALAKMRNRFIRIHRSFLPNFPITQVKMRIGCNRRSKHTQTMDCRSGRSSLVRRVPGGINRTRSKCRSRTQILPTKDVPNGGDQRYPRTAAIRIKDHSRTCPVPRTMYLVVVIPWLPWSAGVQFAGRNPISAPNQKTPPSCRLSKHCAARPRNPRLLKIARHAPCFPSQWYPNARSIAVM